MIKERVTEGREVENSYFGNAVKCLKSAGLNLVQLLV